MHVRSSVVGSGKTWIGFIVGALSVVTGPTPQLEPRMDADKRGF